MGYGIGILLALAVSGFARWTGFDRDRAFYPTVVVVTASYYVLFAVMGGSTQTLVVESLAMTVFVLVAVLGFKFNAWLVVAALVGHGLFDVLHDFVVTNPGVPERWPAFCLTFDIGVAGFLACSGSTRSRRMWSHERDAAPVFATAPPCANAPAQAAAAQNQSVASDAADGTPDALQGGSE
jgi:hypothetical protein